MGEGYGYGDKDANKTEWVNNKEWAEKESANKKEKAEKEKANKEKEVKKRLLFAENNGERCWEKCGESGPCAWCGTGECCRLGVKNEDGSCDGTFGGHRRHECSAKEEESCSGMMTDEQCKTMKARFKLSEEVLNRRIQIDLQAEHFKDV